MDLSDPAVQQRIHAAQQKMLRDEAMVNEVFFSAAFLEETGLKPSEAEMVVEDHKGVRRIYFRARQEPPATKKHALNLHKDGAGEAYKESGQWNPDASTHKPPMLPEHLRHQSSDGQSESEEGL